MRRKQAWCGAGAVAAVVGALLAGSGCSVPVGSARARTATTVSPATADCERSPTIVDCIPPGSILQGLVPAHAERATGTPIRIGTINQDTGAAGAFPELTVADKSAVAFLNDEMDGVDGHPIELLTCNTNAVPDLSQECAQKMVEDHVAAVVGGIDIWGTGIQTLQNNGIPYVGGIPVSFQAARSPLSFQFSGGIWGAVLGMGQYAVDHLHAKHVAIISTEFGPITDAANLGQQALARRGVSTTLVSVAPLNADMVQALNTAVQSHPDVIFAVTADTGCKPAMLTARQLGVHVPIIYTGACAAPNIVDSVNGAAEGSVFNLEADLNPNAPDNVLYWSVARRYGARYGYEPQSAGTASFRAVFNLYVVLRAIGADRITPAAITDAFRAARDAHSFFGHPYTCDGHQLEGYPAICSPQQNLGQLRGRGLVAITDWLDVGTFASTARR